MLASHLQDVWEEFSGPRTYSTPVSTGWEGMDMFYKPVAGELTVVTGECWSSVTVSVLHVVECGDLDAWQAGQT